jgi:hypothetical protein
MPYLLLVHKFGIFMLSLQLSVCNRQKTALSEDQYRPDTKD